MSRGREIIVSAGGSPRGFMEEGIISGTPRPGTLMEIVPAVATVGGRFTWRAATRADGAIGPIVVLLDDKEQGKLGVGDATAFGPGAVGDAFVTGTRGRLYWPAAGEELNLIKEDVAGTGDSVAIGDLFGIDQTDGKLVANSSFASAPFQALEAVVNPTSDFMLWVKYLGNAA